jgi:hypothetical protein
MKAMIFIFLLTVSSAFAGLPPTSSKGNGETAYKTTFKFNFPNVTITRSGSTATFGNISLAGSGTNKNMTAVNGGIVYTDADSMEVSAAGSSGQYLVSGGAGAPTWATVAPGSLQVAVIKDEKTSGTSAGNFVTGTWRVRTLNTLYPAVSPIVTLSANQFIVPAGNYYIDAVANSYGVVTYTKAKIYNVTAAADITELHGTSTYGGTDGSAVSRVTGYVTFAVPTTLELHHICANTTTNGFGITNTGLGAKEVYAQVTIIKL